MLWLWFLKNSLEHPVLTFGLFYFRPLHASSLYFSFVSDPEAIHSFLLAMALFTSIIKPKIFQDSLSHRIFRRMHGVLNIDENKN